MYLVSVVFLFLFPLEIIQIHHPNPPISHIFNVTDLNSPPFSNKIEEKNIYNVFRKYEKKLKVIPLVFLLNHYFKSEWKKADAIIFIGADGFRQKNKMKIFEQLLNDKNKHPYIAFNEWDEKSKKWIELASFKKGPITVQTGPFYLQWSGFTPEDKVQITDDFRWPYKLKQIHLVF